jgi:hypothetical protein
LAAPRGLFSGVYRLPLHVKTFCAVGARNGETFVATRRFHYAAGQAVRGTGRRPVLFSRLGATFGHAAATATVALALTGFGPAGSAHAQSFLESVFGSIDRAIRREIMPRINSYADPYGYDDRRRAYGSAPPSPSGEYRSFSSGFCVRTCDGFHFAVRSTGNMSAAEMCRAFCPAAQTRVFGGSKIDHSVAGDGTRYADTDTAFLYRERSVTNCTCNGRHRFGLATLDPASDPTLRPGDIVATNDGLVTYNGNGKSAEFTPIEQTGGSSEWRRRLMAIKVTPAPPRQATPVPPAEETTGLTDRRRAQR